MAKRKRSKPGGRNAGKKLVFRSAKTGKFIVKAYYKGHGSTTVSEHVPTGQKPAKGRSASRKKRRR